MNGLKWVLGLTWFSKSSSLLPFAFHVNVMLSTPIGILVAGTGISKKTCHGNWDIYSTCVDSRFSLKTDAAILYKNFEIIIILYIKQVVSIRSPSGNQWRSFKVIPQKEKFPNDFLETFPECSLLIPVLKTTIKKIRHRACFRTVRYCYCYIRSAHLEILDFLSFVLIKTRIFCAVQNYGRKQNLASDLGIQKENWR